MKKKKNIKASLWRVKLVFILSMWGGAACKSIKEGQDNEKSFVNLQLERGDDIESLPDSLWRFLALPKTALYASPDSSKQPVAHIPYGTLLALAIVQNDWTQVHCYLNEYQVDNPGTYKLWLPTRVICRLGELSLTPSLVRIQQEPSENSDAEDQAYEVELIDKVTFFKACQHALPRLQGMPWTQFPLSISRPSSTTDISAEEGGELSGELAYLPELDLYYRRGCGKSRCYWELYPWNNPLGQEYWVTDQPLCSPNKQWIYDENWGEATLGAIRIAEGEAKQQIYRHFPCWRGSEIYSYGEEYAFMDAKGWIYLQVCPNVRSQVIGEETLQLSYLRLRLKASTPK